MGSGRNTIYLAEMGFKVEGVEISPEKVNNALELAQKVSIIIRVHVATLRSIFKKFNVV